jgi:hypothetical protein
MSKALTVARDRAWMAAAVAMGAVMISCSDAARSPLMPTEPLLGKTPAAAPSGPSVSSATPNTGVQGTVDLDVTIAGNNFAAGAAATWERNGAPDPGVAVTSTQFVSSKKLVARITIAADADVSLYDVAVTNSDRKKGIGTALFQVTARKGNHPTSTPLVISVVTTPNLASDGVTEPGYAPGEYVSGVSGMDAEFDDSGNLQFSPRNGNATTPPLRTVAQLFGAQLTFPTGVYDANAHVADQHNFTILTRGLNGNPRIQDLADGATGCYPLTIATGNGLLADGSVAYNHRVEYNPALSTGSPATSFVRVTRTGTGTATVWTLASDGTCGGPADVAAVRSEDWSVKHPALTYRGQFTYSVMLTARPL